jgi:catalase-peroxidase
MELTKSPAGAHQWKPVGDAGAGTVPDAHDLNSHQPFMLTTDLSLRVDLVYEKISTLLKIQMNLMMHSQERGLN